MFLRLCILLSCIVTWPVAFISPQWQDLTVLVEPVELPGQILKSDVYIRADPGSNGSASVVDSQPTDNTGLTWDNAVGKGNNIDTLLRIDDLSQCGIAQSNFTKWEALAQNGWSKQYQGPPKDDAKNVANWKHAAEKLGWSTDGQKNVQYDFGQLDNVTIDGKIYKGSGALYSNVMHTDGGIFALQAFSPHSKGASQAPSLDGSPGHELVPLQTWADVSFLEWIDACGSNDKCVKGLKMITKCHAQSNATMQIARQVLGGIEKWAAWPGQTFNKDSEQFAALMATPSGRGVTWLLLSHRKQLGWKSVSKINLWSDSDHDSKSNYFTFQLEDGASQTRSARSTGPKELSSVHAVERHTERDAKDNDSSIIYDSDSVSARYEELFASDHNYSYDRAQEIGGYLVNLTTSSAEQSCVQQSQWKFSDLKSNGWDSTTSKLDDKAALDSLETIFSDAKLSIDDENPEHTVWEHARSSVVNGKTYPATHAKYDALYSKHAIALLGASSPASASQKDEKELLPSLKALSDVLWLQWADWSNAKKNEVKDLRFIMVYQATNSYTSRLVGHIFNNQPPPKYPGKTFESDSKELRALLASPHGQGIVWLLSQHKSELGTKTVKSVQIWNEQQPCLMFEIVSLESKVPRNAGKVSPAESEAVRKSLLRRADSWEQAVPKGKNFLDMLKCGTGRPSEFTSTDDLEKWGWMLEFNDHISGELDGSQMNAIKYLGASFSEKETWESADIHDKDTTVGGIAYPPTYGSYENYYAPEFIIASFNYGPQKEAASLEPPVTIYPKLERLSDVMFLEYQRNMGHLSQPMTGLKGLLAAGVVSQESRDIVARALGLGPWGSFRVPDWPGVDFDAGSDEGAALLASPNGRAPVWLLATHKEQLGHKTISKVKVFGKDPSRLYILFVFGDVNVDSGDSGDADDAGDAGDAGASVSQRKRDQILPYTGQSQGQIVRRSGRPTPAEPATDSAWAKFVEKGKTFLDILNCGSGPQSEWTKYDDLSAWGWRQTINKPVEEALDDEMNAMKYLELSPVPTLTSIQIDHNAASDNDGVHYFPTHEWYGNHYSSEFISAMSNYGPSHGEDNPTGPLPKLHHLSDVWFLAYSQLMSTQNKPLDQLKGILRYNVMTEETKSLLYRAMKTDRVKVRQNPPKWPGTDFEAGSDEFAALLASPHGRRPTWLLINHKQLGNKTIDRVRVWFEHRDRHWMMLFVFKDVTDESRDQPQPPSTDVAQTDNIQQSSKSAVALRAIGLSPEKYKDMLGKGKWLWSALQSTEDCFPQSEFTKCGDLAEWGWIMEFDAKAGPRKSQAAKSVFDFVKASWDANANRMVLDTHDVTKEKDGKTYHRNEARYTNYYNPSLIIAKSNFGPAFWGPRQDLSVKGGADDPFPLLSRLSDILFLEFQRVMTENKQPMKELKGFWRESVENQDTKELATQVSSDNGMLHGIPKWPGVDYSPDSDEFAALLGSPNGVGVAYILLQHREQLGQKTIKSVKVWYDMALHILFMVDDLENQPNASQRRRRSQVDSSSISPYLKLGTWTSSLHSRALDDATYNKLAEKWKALVTALQSTDTCLAQSEWTMDESLATWGWYWSRKPNVGPVSHFTATKQVYEFVGASMDNNMNHRAMDMHDTKKEIDGITYYKTGAEFDNRYNPVMIIAEGIYGAEYQGKDKNPPVTGDPNPFPKLKFWSDVTFLEFQKFMKDSNQALDSLKAVWHRMIINPDTRELAARLTGVKGGTDVPDWPGKDFKPGSDEFASLIGSDNGKSVVYLLLQHRSQLGAKTVTNARVWKDHSLHVVYGINDSCAGGDTDAPQTPSRFRRLDEPDSQKVNDARDAGRFLIMAQDSSADILESCLGIPQSEFNEPKQLGESGWTKLSDYSGAVEEDRDAATFNSWLDMNLDLSENSNHQIEYQHLDKTTGSDGIVYYPSGAYYKNLYNEGGIAALDNASPWKSGRDRDPPVDGKARPFPPLKQWSDAVFLTYKDFCKGDLVKMKKLKGCLRHNVVNTGAKEVLHEYMDKHGDLQDNKPKPWPGTEYKLDVDDGFNVALGVPNGKGVAYLLATHRESLGWKEIYSIRIFSTDWHGTYNILYYIRDHKDTPSRRDLSYEPTSISRITTPVRDPAIRVFGDGQSNDQIRDVEVVKSTDTAENRRWPRVDAAPSETYTKSLERGTLLICKLHGTVADVPQSQWVSYDSLAQYGWQGNGGSSIELGQEYIDILKALNLPAQADANIQYTYSHDKPSSVDGQFYPKTGGQYVNTFNVEGGAIIADINLGPDHIKKNKGKTIVPLKQYSDIVFLAWQKAAGDKTKGLKYIFRHAINNEETKVVIREVLAKRGTSGKPWRGLRIDMTDHDAWALLGTPNGRGPAWILSQHKEQLGRKSFSAITVFSVGGMFSFCFEVEELGDSDVGIPPDLQSPFVGESGDSVPKAAAEAVKRSNGVASTLGVGERMTRAISMRVGGVAKNWWTALRLF